MPLIVEIPDESLEYLSDEAKDELKNTLFNYSSEIVKEAGRLEASTRNDNERPEITRQIIKSAVTFQKDPFRRKGKSTKFIICQIISSIFILLTGIIYDFESFSTNSVHLIIFLIVITIAIISTTSFYFIGRDEQ